jgi:hypothetical protein
MLTSPLVIPRTDTSWINNIGGPQRHYLMALLSAARNAQAAATTSGANEKHKRSFTRWPSFLSSVGLQHDFFLNNFTIPETHQILSAFLEAICSNKFSKNKNNRSMDIKAESCSATLGHLAQAFTAADRPDPRLTQDGKIALILRQQIKGYSNLDPSKSPQQALPISILLHLHSTVITNIDKAAAELLIGASFFAMRSCKYCTVQGERKTKSLALKNFQFFRNKKLLDLHNNDLQTADYMKITFESPKIAKKKTSSVPPLHTSPDSLPHPNLGINHQKDPTNTQFFTKLHREYHSTKRRLHPPFIKLLSIN